MFPKSRLSHTKSKEKDFLRRILAADRRHEPNALRNPESLVIHVHVSDLIPHQLLEVFGQADE